MGLLGEIGELFLPRRCAGCGREDVSLCTACLSLLAGIPRAMEPRYGTLMVIGISEYNARLSHMVVNFKDNGRRDILDPLSLALTRTIAAALEHLGYAGGPIWVVPAPSSQRARRRRGGSHLVGLARRAAQLSPDMDLHIADVLRMRRRHDQVGLSAGSRARNAAGTQFIDPDTSRAQLDEMREGSGSVLLIDDFSTTGATLAESARVLASVQIKPAVAGVLGLGRGGTRFVSPFTV